MSTSHDNDDQQRFALGFLGILITLVVFTVVGTVVYKQRAAKPAAVQMVDATAVPADIATDVPSIRTENGVVKFYFVVGKADVAERAGEALTNVIQGVAAGHKAVVSGYHDASGDAAANEELSKQRALAVRMVLISLGVPEDHVELKKPEATTGTGNPAEARRVEVQLID